MKIENKEEYIKYRFQRAEDSFDDALILIENKKWNTAINRLYYSCFYAVIALLLKNDIETRTHDGARTKFSNEFIKTGKLDKKYGKLSRRCKLLVTLELYAHRSTLTTHYSSLITPSTPGTPNFSSL